MTIRARGVGIFLGVGLLAALPGLAVASPPSDIAVGQIDAILDFCAKGLPEETRAADELRHEATHEAVSGARHSKTYQQSYDKEAQILAQGDRAKEITACRQGLRHKSEHEHQEHPGHHEGHK
jgi:hypothetical protein